MAMSRRTDSGASRGGRSNPPSSPSRPKLLAAARERGLWFLQSSHWRPTGTGRVAVGSDAEVRRRRSLSRK
eukprot:1885369-Alexandrium_andersonii.AAC.1